MKYYFTLIRNSGFGDYASTANKVCSLLENYEFVVLKNYKYKNYHCPDIDFIDLFYEGLQIETKNTKFVSLEEALKEKPNKDEVFIIKISDNEFESLLKVTPRYNLFSYKPKSNPFVNEIGIFVVLHIRASDIIGKRKIINPLKAINFIEKFLIKYSKKINLIICSDLEEESKNLLQFIEELQSKENITILKKIVGRSERKTIESMDSFYHADFIFSKSSSFINLFKSKIIEVPNEYCFNEDSSQD